MKVILPDKLKSSLAQIEETRGSSDLDSVGRSFNITLDEGLILVAFIVVDPYEMRRETHTND